jgi:hypothetical protein
MGYGDSFGFWGLTGSWDLRSQDAAVWREGGSKSPSRMRDGGPHCARLCAIPPVRRLLSITLLLLFSYPLIAPVFALGGTMEANLPACCRKNGVHRCTLSDEQAAALSRGEQLPAAYGICPMFPATPGLSHHSQLTFDRPAMFYAEALSHPAQHRQTEAWARVALAGARHKRGPPSIRLS